MTHSESTREESSRPLKPFRMLSIYDSARASREAAHASEVLLRELGDDVVVDKNSWNVRSLESDALRTRAADQAARADVILLALSGDSPSAELKNWVTQWEKNRELSGGLIALIPCDSETGGDLADYLYETAVSANMDFLCRKKRRF